LALVGPAGQWPFRKRSEANCQMIELPVEANSHLEPPQGLARVVTQSAWIASTALGSLALAGWLLNVPTLYSGWPRPPHVTVNGALTFLLLGLALRLTMNGSGAHQPVALTYRLGQVLGFLVAVVGALILMEYLLKRNFGIDELIIKDPSAAAYKGIPGRPSFPAALNGIFLGLGTLLLGRTHPREMAGPGVYCAKRVHYSDGAARPPLRCLGALWPGLAPKTATA
jgi:hypothetical protein